MRDYPYIEIKQDELLQLQKDSNLSADEIIKNSLQFKSYKYIIVGCGGVGSIIAELLVRSGCEQLVLVDLDTIEESNLGRQNFEEEDILEQKTIALRKRLERISRRVMVEINSEYVSAKNCDSVCSKGDIIIDCTDNLKTRRILNSYCLEHKKMWIYSGAQGFESVCCIFDYRNSEKDMFSNIISANTIDESNCQSGVLNSTTHITASFIINELLKYVCLNMKESRLVKFNSLHNTFYSLKL